MTRLPALVALAGPVFLLGAALISQYAFGLLPCEMCIWQRWPHGAAIALGLCALLLGRGLPGALLLVLAAAAVLISGGIGYFHAGVELGWWDGPSACSGGSLSGVSTAEAIQAIFDAPLVRCDEVAWSFLGVSMAGWNGILSTLFGFAALIAARAYSSSSASQYR